jgi:hypothetical protein
MSSRYMRFEVIKAVKMSMLYDWVVMPCGLVSNTNVSEEILPPSSGLLQFSHWVWFR